ncbi:MAG: protein-L-isoaspartate(D-aspartate) O-methyltransferase [Candidatus Hydrogenedentota bacterium]
MLFSSRSNSNEPDYDRARRQMVETQVARRGVQDTRVLEAMGRVPRHRFVPAELAQCAYEDKPLHIGCGQTISQPYMVARMTELLALRAGDRVLEVGTGSGYQTALLAELAREVVSIERHEALADQARTRLEACGYENVQVVCGDGTLGWPERAPYDAILVTAGSPKVPAALVDQLAEGGRLVCPAGTAEMQRLRIITREGGELHERDSISCVFVPLVGAQGWPEHPSR